MQPSTVNRARTRLTIPIAVLAVFAVAAVIAAIVYPTYAYAASPQKAAVTGLTVVDGADAGAINVSWDAHPEAAREYRLTWAPNGQRFKGKNNSKWNAFPTGTSHSITGLDEDTTYKFKVRAKFANPPVSNWSSRVTFTTAEAAETTSPPAQVKDTAVAQDAGDTPVTVSWSASEDATKYQVERKNDPPVANTTVITNIADTSTSYEDDSTDYNTGYRYRVRAGNDAGYGTWSTMARITTKREPGTPEAPNAFTAVEEDAGKIETSWTAPSGTEEITGYRVYRDHIGTSGDSENVIATLGSDITSYADDNIAAESIYIYWVRAYNDTGESPNSRRETVTTMVQSTGVPEAPTRIRTTEDTAGEVVVTWLAPTDGAAATQYRVYRKLIGTSDNDVIATVDAPALTHTDDTVVAEKWYQYQVQGVNEAGDGTMSGTQTIKTRVQTPGVPHAPKRLDATEETAGEVVLTWQAPADGPNPTGYDVYRKTFSGADARIGSTAADVTTYTDDTVAAETWYDYRVRAKNAAGHGSESGVEYIKTQVQTEGVPPPPEETEADQ